MTTQATKHTKPPSDYVRIFDTTLRDGEQCPGATLTSEEKLEVARALSRLGVDVIEAGFPSASPDDFQAVHDIAETIGIEPISGRPSSEPPIICGLARATEKDIQTAFDAIKIAKYPRIHIFLATSPLHREHKLRMTREQVVERARTMVTFAKTMCDDIEFSPEDAGRTEPDFLHEVLTAVIECGATTLNIPDTVGYTVPAEFGAIIDGIMKNVKGVENVVVSVHCHDDLGLATANALAGIHAGARQAEVTINGIGERAGNTSLEEVVMALQTRQPLFGLKTGIDATQLVRTSRLVSVRTGMVVPPNKAIVGANAFAHESGIHQDGMLKHAGTYEIMRPETVGASKTLLVMGKHSGRHAFSVRLKELGHALEGEALEAAFQRFKILADKKKRITDADLEALAASEVGRGIEYYALDAVQVVCGSSGMPTATVRLRCPDGELRTQAAVGTGPVHAVFTAIDDIVKAPSELVEYTINAVTEGIDALGHASVRVRNVGSNDNRLNAQHGSGGAAILHGQAADSDVLVASTKAYLGALNRLLVTLGTYDKQADKSQVTEKQHVREQNDDSRGVSMAKTLFEKIWNEHVVVEEAGRPAVLYVDLHLIHEVTSPQAFSGLRARNLKVRRPERTVATMDHSTPTLPKALQVIDDQARAQLSQLEKNCTEFGIRLFALGNDKNGIVHVVGPERGFTQPGMTIVCGDSHTSTHGAFGSLAFGIGTSEVEHVLASQCLLQSRPKTMEVRIDGTLSPLVTAKDIILAVIAKIGTGGGTGYVIEYTGSAIRALDMEARMTVCNMSIEAGARAGLIAPDEKTFEYVKGREFAPKGAAWDAALERWKKLPTDAGATYDTTVTLDANEIEPMITYGTHPGMAVPITQALPTATDFSAGSERQAFEKAMLYMGLEGGRSLMDQKIDVVFVGSCTNGRISDLRLAASVLKGRHVAAGVRALIVPGSQEVKRQAEAEGLDRIFTDAGAEWREAGCSMCIAMNGDQLSPGQYAVSTSNRNFEGRQGKGGRTFLASPLTAAASAVTGKVTDVRSLAAV